MEKSVHYHCPHANNCRLHKHCHVLKTVEKLKFTIRAIVKCPAQKNKEITVEIGPT